MKTHRAAMSDSSASQPQEEKLRFPRYTTPRACQKPTITTNKLSNFLSSPSPPQNERPGPGASGGRGLSAAQAGRRTSVRRSPHRALLRRTSPGPSHRLWHSGLRARDPLHHRWALTAGPMSSDWITGSFSAVNCGYVTSYIMHCHESLTDYVDVSSI